MRLNVGDLVVNPDWDQRIGVVLDVKVIKWMGTMAVTVYSRGETYSCLPPQLELISALG
jgi:hypothetical protein